MQNSPLKRIVIACGGTGGHFYPGYALAKALKAAGWEPLFTLRRADPAGKNLDEESLSFVEVDLRGMPRGLSLEWVRFPWKLIKSLWVTARVLRSYRPRCVIGMGGYLTFPVVFSAWRLGIPSLIHEANAMLGLANRMCLPFVSKIALGLPLHPLPLLGERVGVRGGGTRFELTGTPIRDHFQKLPDSATARREFGLDPQKTTFLIFGGSQGARAVNRLVPQALKELDQNKPDSFQCIHLSGPNDEAEVRAAYAGMHARAKILPYSEEIFKAYAAADLIISRAGASTLAELIATQKPAILIPFPAATGNHQEANANVLVRVGAALSFRQADLTPSHLATVLSDLIPSEKLAESKLERMRDQYSRLTLPTPQESLQRLVELVEGL